MTCQTWFTDAVILKERANRTLQEPGDVQYWTSAAELGAIPSVAIEGRGAYGNSRQALMLQRRLGVPSDQTIVCGMALGYPDPNDKVNTFTPERMPVAEFVTWVERLRD